MAAGDEFAVVIFLVLGLVPAVSGTRLGCCDFPIACPSLAPVLCTVHCALCTQAVQRALAEVDVPVPAAVDTSTPGPVAPGAEQASAAQAPPQGQPAVTEVHNERSSGQEAVGMGNTIAYGNQ